MEDELKCSYNWKTHSINIRFSPIVTLEDNTDLLSYNHLIENMKLSIIHELEHYTQDIDNRLLKSKHKINDPYRYILYFIEPNELDATLAAANYIHKLSNNELSFIRSIGQEFITRFEIGAKSNKIEDILIHLEDISSIKSKIYALLLKYLIINYLPTKINYLNIVKDDKEYVKLVSNYKKDNLKEAFIKLKQILFYINDNILIYNKFNNILYNNINKILDKPYKELTILLDNILEFIESNKN